VQHTASSYDTPDDSYIHTNLLYNASSLSKAAVMSIFAKYGQDDSLSFEGFKELLETLGLGKIHKTSEHHSTLHADDDHSEDDHRHHRHSANDGHSVDDHSHHDHSANDGHSGDEHRHHNDVDDAESHARDEHEHSASSANCTDCLSAEVKCDLISTPAFISSQ